MKYYKITWAMDDKEKPTVTVVPAETPLAAMLNFHDTYNKFTAEGSNKPKMLDIVRIE